MPETQWMTLLETADLMKRLPTQVTRMCEDGKLEYYREDGRYFVSRESIDLFMHPQTGASTTRQTGEPEVGVDRRSTALRALEADAGYPEHAGTDVHVEDTSAGADSPTDSIQGANGTSRRKYGRAPEEFGASSQTVPGPAIGQEAAGAGAEEETGTPSEESPAAHEETVETIDAVDEDEAPEAAEAPDSDGALAEPVDGAQQIEETQIYGDTGSEQPTQETDQEVSTMIPEGSTQQVTEILADLREAIARHAEAHKVFCDEVSGLADALESALSTGEDKTNELTREISSLLARYTKR